MSRFDNSYIPGTVVGEPLFVEPASSSLELASVLVVDDSHSMGRIMDRLLTSLGIAEIGHAADAATAFRLMHERTYDMVVLYVEMEAISGIELLRAMRGHARTRHLPVLMMTASRNVDYVVAAKMGADGYILKPFDKLGLKTKMLETVARGAARART